MTNWNLESFDNIYAALAESAYKNRPNWFAYEQLTPREQAQLDAGKPLKFDFSKNANDNKGQVTQGGQNLPHDGKVYLQPDEELHRVKETMPVNVPDKTNPEKTHVEAREIGSYQKGLLTDEKAGFNAYFVTDSPTVSAKTTKAYLTIRGSDGMKLANWNDWVSNDAHFALQDGHIPQAKLATKAMKAKLEPLKQKAPHAKLDITGHSLGTMVSIQGAAKLSPAELERVDRIVLFDGPDATDSLKQMGLSSKAIASLGQKVTYYVNPLDVVSMLNRETPVAQQLGTVHMIVPTHFTGSFDSPSSHDFGAFQLDAKGNPLTASATFHPELLTAGHRLAVLVAQTLARLQALGISDDVLDTLLRGHLIERGTAAYGIYQEFQEAYQTIVAETRQASEAWDRQAIPQFQEQIKQASGSQKVLLRSQLLQTVAQLATLEAEDKAKAAKARVTAAKERISQLVRDAHEAAHQVGQFLTASEIDAMLAEFQLSDFWDEGVEAATNQEADKYQTHLGQFSETLQRVSQGIEEVDRQGAAGFEQLMSETRQNWGQ